MDVKQVKELNARIEKIQTQRTKVETKREMMLANLSTELEKYAATYGVDMRTAKLSSTKAAVEKEKAAVEGVIKQEYELKNKVVSAIESGDIALAKRLLGVVDTADEEEFPQETADGDDFDSSVEQSESSDESDELWDDESEESAESGEFTESGESADAFSDDEFEGVNFNDGDEYAEEEMATDSSAEESQEESDDSPWGDLSVEDEAEEQPVVSSAKSFLDAVDKVDRKKKGNAISDFDDSDLDDFGFGSITKGTKFGKK